MRTTADEAIIDNSRDPYALVVEERDRMREALEDISGSIPARWQDGDKEQRTVYWAIQRGLYGRDGR